MDHLRGTTVSEQNAMIRALAACIESGVSSMIWGLPGQGKTAKIEALGSAFGRHVEIIVASAHEAVDFTGLPIAVDDEVVYAPLKWATDLAAAERGGLLFIDEFTTAGSAQKALLRIVNERYVGKVHLGDHVSVIAAANPPEVAVDGMDLAAPTANRFIHLDWVFDLQEWLTGVGSDFAHVGYANPRSYLTGGSPADRARATQLITGFLATRPELATAMPEEDITAQGKAWPSPRSWTNVIHALTYLPMDDEDARALIVRGGVGDAAAVEMFAWEAANDLHDPQSVLEDPSIVQWSRERPDRVFALLSGVQTLVALDGSEELWLRGIQVAVAAARGNRPDSAIPFARVLAASTHARGGLPESFRSAFVDIVARTGRVRRVA